MLNKILTILNKDKIKTELYLLLFLCFGFFLGWCFKSYVIQLITLILYVLPIVLFSYNAMLLAPILLVGMFTLPSFMFFDTVPILLIVEIVIFLLSCLTLFIKNIINKKQKFNFGSIGKSLILLFIVLFISVIARYIKNDSYYDTFGFIVIGILGLLVLLYLFFNNYKEERKEYIFSLFYLVNIVIILEVLISCIINKTDISGASFFLGWSINNNILCIAIECLCCFLFFKIMNKNRKDIIIIMLLDLFVLISSKSRIGFLIGLILLFFFLKKILGVYVNKKHRKLLILIISLIVLISIPLGIETIKRFLIEGVLSPDREAIWNGFLNAYSGNIILGKGITIMFELHSSFSWAEPGTIGMYLPHNYFVTILSIGGLLGLIVFIYHLYEMIKTSLSLEKYYKYVYLLFIAIGLIHGLVDNTFFSIEYMIPYIIMFSVIYKRKEENYENQ